MNQREDRKLRARYDFSWYDRVVTEGFPIAAGLAHLLIRLIATRWGTDIIKEQFGTKEEDGARRSELDGTTDAS